ncbi:MAG TPA: SpoVR family protein [Armatimonadota bacterium]|jgi:stage V sporulation protein R
MAVADIEVEALSKAIEEIWAIGERFGLDAYPTHFEIVPAAIMYEFGAYGLPGRFSHWTHGKAFHQMKTMYDYGLSKIYELVVNTNPCYAFLMEGNSLIQNKLVIAHVMAHCDFFKNNIWFAHTSRKMVDVVSVNARRIDKYSYEHGEEVVERFLDATLALQEHVDPNVQIRHLTDQEITEARKHAVEPTTPYDDLWKLERKGAEERHTPRGRKLPEEPQRDLLRFIMDHAPELEDWQRDCIGIVRQEMLYFYPQMQTKIMNEGWASLWHARVLRELDLSEGDYITFAELNSSVVSPGSRRQLNPYYVGLKIWEDLIQRWDNPSEEDLKKPGRAPGQGLEKIFEVREMENDVSFLRNYLTEELVEELDLYVYRKEGDQWVVVEKDWEKVRDAMVGQMTNFGYPYLVVEDGDYRRNRELYLKHYFEGRELDLNYAKHALHHVYTLWGRTVHLETVVEGQTILLSYDGEADSMAHLS